MGEYVMRKILSLILIFCLAILPVWAYTEYQQGQTSTVFRGPVVFFNSTSSGAVPISSANPLPVSLPSSGTAIIGKVGIDQTTPGTTNLVQITDGSGAVNTIIDSGTLTTVSTVTTLTNFPDNEPFNVAQIGGGSTLVAAAATDTTGTGVQTTGPLLQFDDTSTATVTEDRFAPPRISSRRNQQIEGDVASDTPIAAKPVTVGGKAQSSNNTPVTDGDAVDDFKDTQGRTIVEPFAPAALVAQQRTTISNTSETTIVTAAGASVFADIAAVSCLNTSATATYITLKDATGGTSRWDIPCPANKLSDGIIFPVPLPQASSNNNWTATAADTVSSLIVNVEYRKRK
jgi:hypothetical protein